MSKIAFVTDTVACLPEDLRKKYNIKVVASYLVINGKSYRDGIDMDNDTFWKQFETMQSFSTAAASIGDFMNAFKEAGQEAENIVCILVSKALSGTVSSAVQAKNLLKEENSKLTIEVIDSRTAIGAEGYLVLEAAKAAAAGKSLPEILQLVQDLITRVKWVNAMETTKYLIKIGRAPKTLPIEVFAQLKPMIAMLHNTGLVEDPGIARTREESFQKMVDMIGQNTDAARPLHVWVHYTSSLADGEELASMIKAKYNPAEIHMTPYSALLCGTTGPCNAVAFYS